MIARGGQVSSVAAAPRRVRAVGYRRIPRYMLVACVTVPLLLAGCGGGPPAARSLRRALRLRHREPLLVDDGRRLDRARRSSSGCSSLAWVRRNQRGIGRDTDEPKAGERTGWFVVVGGGRDHADRADRGALRRLGHLRDPDDGGARGDGDAAHGARDRPPVVVGDPLPGHDGGHRERDPHPGADAGAGRGADRRRDPQLLGARARTGRSTRSRARRTRSSSTRTTPGTYRGQCAEFCGAPARAHVARGVRAARPAQFRALARRPERAAAAAGRRRAARRGEQSSSTCAPSCHTIRGTSAERLTSGPT